MLPGSCQHVKKGRPRLEVPHLPKMERRTPAASGRDTWATKSGTDVAAPQLRKGTSENCSFNFFSCLPLSDQVNPGTSDDPYTRAANAQGSQPSTSSIRENTFSHVSLMPKRRAANSRE